MLIFSVETTLAVFITGNLCFGFCILILYIDIGLIRCQACGHDNVTTVKLDQRVPLDVRPFLTPFPKQIEQFFAVAQFQYVGMLERIQFQDNLINKLVSKMNKQKQLLSLAKEKISQVESLELKIKQLEIENNNLRKDNRPSTIDLTMNESFENNLPKSFINQIKHNSTQKLLNKRNYTHDLSLDFAKNKIAESTNIRQSSPLQSNIPIGNNLHPVRSASSNSNYSSSSSKSYSSTNTSFFHEKPNQITTLQVLQPKNRPKQRASTSQIAQRLSAHMKIGSLSRNNTSNGLRPGSAFSNNKFRK